MTFRTFFSAAVVLLALLVSPHPGEARTTGMASFTCPIGGEKFEAEVEMSGTVFCQRLDFKRIGMVGEPPLVPVCPSNGFPIFSDTFSDAEIAKLTRWVHSAEFRDKVREQPSYYKIAQARTVLGQSSFLVAWNLLQASWQAGVKDPGRRLEYLRGSLAHLSSYLEETSSSEPDPEESRRRFEASYLAGEIERRLGHFSKARERFESLLQDTASVPEDLLSAVRQQLDLIAAQDAEPHARQPADEQCEKMVRRGW